MLIGIESCIMRLGEGGNEKVAASTFRLGILEDSKLRELLTMRPSKNMRQLIRHIKEYKRLEDD